MRESVKTRNSEVLTDFIAYCVLHPEERFWQALRNWSDANFIYIAKDKMGVLQDTFFFEGRTR
jgi:hypothetical protein